MNNNIDLKGKTIKDMKVKYDDNKLICIILDFTDDTNISISPYDNDDFLFITKLSISSTKLANLEKNLLILKDQYIKDRVKYNDFVDRSYPDNIDDLRYRSQWISNLMQQQIKIEDIENQIKELEGDSK